MSYRGKTLTWQNGRELATVNGTKTYAYGADGIRTAKTVSGVTTTYALSGSTVLSQTEGIKAFTSSRIPSCLLNNYQV